ncbi:MAG: radical SAM protein [Campylobacteraceae bacterium]|nr:radical SAM protein [Campylobacteraceae bacterium]
MLNIHNIATSNYVNGNGCRYVLWLQGCDLACTGCWNTETWSFEKRILKTVDEVFKEIINLRDTINGITFTGGEPFLQSDELSKLAQLVKENTNLDIQIFSGFDIEELQSDFKKVLLNYTDILVSGRYDKNKINNNQSLYLLNKDIDPWQFNNSDVQIDIDINANIKITGYPTNKLIKMIEKENNARV